MSWQKNKEDIVCGSGNPLAKFLSELWICGATTKKCLRIGQTCDDFYINGHYWRSVQTWNMKMVEHLCSFDVYLNRVQNQINTPLLQSFHQILVTLKWECQQNCCPKTFYMKLVIFSRKWGILDPMDFKYGRMNWSFDWKKTFE